VTPTGIVVQKYGGSSVADVDKLRLVAKRIARTKAAGKKVVVVVSAMGKTTNSLIEKGWPASIQSDCLPIISRTASVM
jgi:aspartate kinase